MHNPSEIDPPVVARLARLEMWSLVAGIVAFVTTVAGLVVVVVPFTDADPLYPSVAVDVGAGAAAVTFAVAAASLVVLIVSFARLRWVLRRLR